MSRRVVANLAVFTIVAAAFLVWAVTNLLKIDTLQKPYKIRGHFSSAVGLLAGAEVDYLGVTYGTVADVKRVPGGALVTMKIDNGKRIPQDSTASIFRKSALGEQYVNFTPPDTYGGTGGPWYQKGTSIPESRTTVPLEFSELLRSASRLIGGIPADSVRTLVHELALGLQGRGDSLRQLADSGDKLGQTLADRTAALDRLAINNTRLTHVITEHRGSLGQSLSDLRQLADSLKNARGNTSILLERGSQLLGQTADLVASHKADLDCDLKTLEAVTDLTTTKVQLANLATVLDVAPTAFDHLLDATDVDANSPFGGPGRWIRVGFKVNVSYHKAPQFVPPKALPKVKDIPACDSRLRAAGIDYRPVSASSAPLGSLPDTGGAGLVGGLVLLAAALVLRMTRQGVASGG